MSKRDFDIPTLQRLDAAHHLHPFSDNAALAGKPTSPPVLFAFW